MSKNIIVTAHSGKEDFKELISRLILLKIKTEMQLEKHFNSICTKNIYKGE